MSNRIIQLGNLREGTTTMKNPSGGRVFSGGGYCTNHPGKRLQRSKIDPRGERKWKQ